MTAVGTVGRKDGGEGCLEGQQGMVERTEAPHQRDTGLLLKYLFI